MIECPPKFRHGCIDFDGEKCPYYDGVGCIQPQVDIEAAKQGIPLPDTDLDKPDDKRVRDCVECLEHIEQTFDNKPWRHQSD